MKNSCLALVAVLMGFSVVSSALAASHRHRDTHKARDEAHQNVTDPGSAMVNGNRVNDGKAIHIDPIPNGLTTARPLPLPDALRSR